MTELKEHLFRELGYHERFILVRHNLGHPPVICCVAQGKGGRAEREKLENSIKEKIRLLLDTHALLSSHIHASRTDHPRYARWVRDVPVQEVFSSSSVDSISLPGQMLKEHVTKAKQEFKDISKGPLWRVRLRQDDATDTFVVILTTHHFIMDGRGMGNVLEMLLSSSSSSSFEKSITTSLQEIPPTAESSVKKYEIGFLNRRFVDLLTMLPTRLAMYLIQPPTNMWPKESDVKIHPTQAEERHTVTTFQGEDNLLMNLKEQAQKHKVKTIHPLINTACLIALYSITGDDTHYHSDSPISERVGLSKHTLYSGNYVSVQARAGTLRRNLKVWDEARSFAHDAVANRTKARQLFGELGYLMTQLSARSSKYIPTEECPTACDDFFARGLHSTRPLRASYGLSNLGAIQGVPSIIEKVYWAQPVQPMLDAITIGVCGFGPGKGKADDPKVDKAIGAKPTESVAVPDKDKAGAEAAPPSPPNRDGLSISVGCRVGVLEDGKEETFIDTLNKTLRLMASDLDDSISFAEMLTKVQSV